MNLVFASGFLLPQHIGPIEYFNGVDALAKRKGHRPIFPPVEPLASSADRAAALAQFIQDGFPTGSIHIIAHSMGGLDSRVLIAADHPGLAGRIVSLTTLSTPFHGSPLADLVRGESGGVVSLGLGVASNVIDGSIGRLIDLGAVGDLTRKGAEAGPDILTTHPRIRCRSYAASGRASGRATSKLLFPGHEFILGASEGGGPNDGAVTVESAKYGKFMETWPCDHLDQVGHDLDNLPLLERGDFDHIAKFTEIIDLLQREHPGT